MEDITENLDTVEDDYDSDTDEEYVDTVFCYCSGPETGLMIACDNDSCETEWFHADCAGFTEDNLPNGKWFCDDCKKCKLLFSTTLDSTVEITTIL